MPDIGCQGPAPEARQCRPGRTHHSCTRVLCSPHSPFILSISNMLTATKPIASTYVKHYGLTIYLKFYYINTVAYLEQAYEQQAIFCKHCQTGQGNGISRPDFKIKSSTHTFSTNLSYGCSTL